MPTPLHKLISDTLLYLKDPLLPKQSMFASAEETALFHVKQVTPVKKVPDVELPLPRITQARPLPPKRETPPTVVECAVESKSSPLPAPRDDTSPLKKALLRIAPHMKLVEEIPDDAVAKRIGSAWKEKIVDAEVILLACVTDAETLEFLKNLGKAVDQKLAKAKILPAERLERENRWDLFLQKNNFRLIIASEGMQNLPGLMRFYRAVPAQSQYYLDKTPLVALSPASIYKSLEHKAALWKTLCHYCPSQK